MMTEKPALQLLRSILIFPANVPRFIENAPHSAADAVCLDLEDSVPPDAKATARAAAVGALHSLAGSRSALLVRVNGPASGLLEDDLISVVQPGLDGIILSKTEFPEDVVRADHYLTLLERERGIAPGSVAIIALIETAAGVARCHGVCAASARLVGALFGAEDFATDMGVQRTADGQEVLWARAQVAVACRAQDILAIDTPATAYSDEVALEREMTFARTLGYRGKLCIHPAQVAIANRVFSPAPGEIAAARDLVDAFEREGIAQARAAIVFGGRMVDTPMYVRAKRLLEWAESVEHLD